MGKLTAWAEKILSAPECVKVLGKIQMCAKPIKPTCVEDVVVKKDEKKAAPAPAAKKAVEEKKKDNVESLPPSPWVVYDFKTFYVNHKDKKGAAVDTWMKELDWAGWSFWHFHYEKFGTEG